VIHFTI